MSADLILSICNMFVLPGWLLLVFLPRWKWTLGVISAGIIPFVIGIVYLGLMLSQLSNWPEGAGFGSVAELNAGFSNPYILVAGFIHYLAFDLFLGCWEVRDAQKNNIPHWMVVPCLIPTFLAGPIGLALYLILRTLYTRKFEVFPPLKSTS